MTKKRTFSIGPGVECDVDRLISTRLLVQANSGGGKSFTLRRPAEVRNRIVQMLGGASARLLDPLIKAYPKAMERQDLAAAANYGNLNSKGFVNAIGRLRSLGFIDYPDRGHVAAQPVLFLEN